MRRHLGLEEGRRPPGEVDLRPQRGVPDRRARPRPCQPRRARDRRPGQHPGPAGDHQGEPRRLHVDVLLLDPDLPLRHAARGPVQDPGDLRRGAGLLHQHRAGGRLSRRRPARGLVPARDADGPGGARAGQGSGRVPPPELHPQGRLPVPDAGGADVRHRQLRGDARRGAQARRLCRLPGAQGRVRAARQAARHRPLLLHRGLRHRPLGGGGLARCRRRPVGECQGPLHPHRQGAGDDRHPQPRPGPRDHLRPGGGREAGRALRGHRRHPRRHRQDPGRHGHLRLALAGGRRRGRGQRLQQDRREGQEDRGPPDGGGRGRHRVQGRPVHRGRHRQVGRHRPGRVHRLRAAQLPAGRASRASRSRRSSIRRTSPTRRAPTSASSRSTRPRAWSRSSSSWRSTISATWSTR